jgi:hypothetical protein
MKEYKVKITATIDTSRFVDAENEEEACLIAEREWGATYIIHNPDTNEFLDFSDIIGYEPEELANGE